MMIWRERAGVVSPGPVWVGMHRDGEGVWLYFSGWFVGLVLCVLLEWKAEKHRVA